MDITLSNQYSILKEISIPPSKSAGQRLVALAVLIDKITISNLGSSADTVTSINVLKSCGYIINQLNTDTVEIYSSHKIDADRIVQCNESGLSARLFSSLLLLMNGRTTINGNGSLLKRSMEPLHEIYRQLKVNYSLTGNHLPVIFYGQKTPANLEVNGSMSSQFITGLLYYLVGLNHDQDLTLTIHNGVSTPYIDMTIDILKTAGATLCRNENIITISPAKLHKTRTYTVEGDWSSAAYWIVSAAIHGDTIISGLSMNSLQADKAILKVLELCGGSYHWNENNLRVRASLLNGFEIDATDFPDLIPILLVLALYCEGDSTIIGSNRLIHKESNRLQAMLVELSKVSEGISNENNILYITGKSWVNLISSPIVFETYSDHRIVMALSILAIHIQSPCKILGIKNINKSYPDFFSNIILT